MSRRTGMFRGVICGVLVLLASPATGQGVRGTARTTARYLDLRPIQQDTISFSRVNELPNGALEFEGLPVFCSGRVACILYRPQPVQHAVALTQDVSLTAWGLGTPGLSATVLLRGRADLGGDLSLPRSDDEFDAVLAYAELNRDLYRVRLGRQRTFSQLGSSGFDGVDVLVDPLPWLRVQAFGGRALARGLSEPRSEALRGLDDAAFLLDDNALLVGAEVGADGDPGSVALRYQREIWANRSALLSERASLTGRTDQLRPVSLSAAADYDFAFGRVGKAHVTARAPLFTRGLTLEATGRRYVPYFELWTIWGFFSPVAYHEAELRTSWAPSPALSVWGLGGFRAYEETNAPILAEPLKDEAWRAGIGGMWRISDALTLDGDYHLEGPVGAFLSSGNLALAWRPEDRWAVSAHGLAFQQIEEFRIGEGVVVGAGGSVAAEVVSGSRIAGGVDVYRQLLENRPSVPDWNQVRGWIRLEIDFGRDPGGGAR